MKTITYWVYQDSRGVTQRGQMEKHIDRGHNDCTAIMRSETGEVHCVSGSRLKSMRRIVETTPESAP